MPQSHSWQRKLNDNSIKSGGCFLIYDTTKPKADTDKEANTEKKKIFHVVSGFKMDGRAFRRRFQGIAQPPTCTWNSVRRIS